MEEVFECSVCLFPAHTAVECTTCNNVLHEECVAINHIVECPTCRTSPLRVQPSVLARRAVDRTAECRNKCGFTGQLYYVRVHEVICMLEHTKQRSEGNSSLKTVNFNARNPQQEHTPDCTPRSSPSGKGVLAEQVHIHPLYPSKEAILRCDGSELQATSMACLVTNRAEKQSLEGFTCTKCEFKICQPCFVKALSCSVIRS